MAAPAWRFPAEWEPQSAVALAWPHTGTDWAPRLDAVESCYVHLIGAIARFDRVLLCVADEALRERARALLARAGTPIDRIVFACVEYDDTWLRDSGPITLVPAAGAGVQTPESSSMMPRAVPGDLGRFHLLDFRFNAWGDKFAATRDDRLVENLCARDVFNHAHRERMDFALEGGAIETDGAGTLLCTWHCLHTRHPQLSRAELASRLRATLRQQRVLWLEHGALDGDDTDAHIDTLARFAARDAIVFQSCDDPADPHFGELQAMARDLAALRTDDGRPYRLFALPWARPIFDAGRRLATSYANFLIVNGAVLMPAYDDLADARAAAVLENAFPSRQIVPVPCRDLIWQNGSLHCLTMQLPDGLIGANAND